MEKFKAVEKAMKTKAYSKEGLSAAAKLDPKEQAKVEAGEFLSNQVDELEQQIEALEAESESIQATMKKGKNQNAKAERMAEIEHRIERHKWHQGKLELIRRSLENGGVDTDQVNELEETIRYYVTDGMNDDFMSDDEMYDDLALDEDEGAFGMTGDNDRSSSQDNQSVQDEPTPEPEPIAKPTRKTPKESESVRKPSTQTKSPLPALATLHTPLSTIGSIGSGSSSMKPASIPTRPAGDLKYASAAAAAAASEKNSVGISPLPPPPGTAAPGVTSVPVTQAKGSATNSPAITAAQPATASTPQSESKPSPLTTSSAPVAEVIEAPKSKRKGAKQAAQAEATEAQSCKYRPCMFMALSLTLA